MKLRNLLLLLTFLAAVSVLLCILSNDRTGFNTILSETHKHLANLKHLQDNLKQHGRRELLTQEKYLKALGFTAKPKLLDAVQGSSLAPAPAPAPLPAPLSSSSSLFPPMSSNSSIPVIVTALWPGQLHHALGFLKSIRRFLPHQLVWIYLLNLEQSDIDMLNKSCNSSTCALRQFDLDFFPKHVSDRALSAHRPLIIQDALNDAGAILWLDVTHRLNSNNLLPALNCARQFGVASWPIDKPTSALTHPGMFEFFHTQQENYYFHRMVELSHIVIYNVARIHYDLMLLWIQCTLIPECVAPIGAQSGGCRFDKRPLYRYSGCHHYDESALNVVLGVIFHYDASSYLVNESLFHSVEETVDFEHVNSTSAMHSV